MPIYEELPGNLVRRTDHGELYVNFCNVQKQWAEQKKLIVPCIGRCSTVLKQSAAGVENG